MYDLCFNFFFIALRNGSALFHHSAIEFRNGDGAYSVLLAAANAIEIPYEDIRNTGDPNVGPQKFHEFGGFIMCTLFVTPGSSYYLNQSVSLVAINQAVTTPKCVGCI